MASTFNTIGVIAKPDAESVRQTLHALLDYLKSRSCRVILDDRIPDTLNPDSLDKANRKGLGDQVDLAIVVGGDGTMLNAARSLAHAGVPLLGVNVGRLGFLADISPDQIDTCLNDILDGCYREEQRMLLSMKVLRDGKTIFEAEAFNDVVVHVRDVARMVEFETRINDDFVNHQRADGIVVSTPTGSTAYALSAGGPLLHATLDAITLVPISPHTLSSRPIVVNSSSIIDIMICHVPDGRVQATCDGHESIDIVAGDHVRIHRNDHSITLLHPQAHNHFDILRAKLRWG